MKHLASILFSVIVFALSTVFLVLGRQHIATSLPLLLTVVGGYVLALTIAFPAQMDVAKARAIELYTAWKGGAK